MAAHLTGKAQLEELFKEVNMPQKLQVYFIEVSMNEGLDDFLGTFTRGKYEEEVEAVIKGYFKVKTQGDAADLISPELQRKFVARTRTAYAAALALRDNVESKDKDIADVEAPLGKEDLEQIDKSWKVLHPWKPIPSARACVQLLGRVFREFRTRKCVLHSVELAISMEVDKCIQESPLEPVGVPAGPGQPQLLADKAPDRREGA